MSGPDLGPEHYEPLATDRECKVSEMYCLKDDHLLLTDRPDTIVSTAVCCEHPVERKLQSPDGTGRILTRCTRPVEPSERGAAFNQPSEETRSLAFDKRF